MKKLWVNSVPYEKEVVISALESGAEAIVLPDGKSGTVRQFGKIKTVEKDGDIRPGVDVEFVDISGKADGNKVLARVEKGGRHFGTIVEETLVER